MHAGYVGACAVTRVDSMSISRRQFSGRRFGGATPWTSTGHGLPGDCRGPRDRHAADRTARAVGRGRGPRAVPPRPHREGSEGAVELAGVHRVVRRSRVRAAAPHLCTLNPAICNWPATERSPRPRKLVTVPIAAAFFDLDKTVIAKASMVAFGRSFYDEGLISRRLVLRGLWGQLVYMHLGASEQKLARMRESVLALTKGWDQNRVRAIVREALEQVVEPIIYAEALELIQQHQAEGRPVFIVSASPEEIVQPLAEYLGVDGAIATQAEVDEEGRYTGGMRRYAYGPLKAEAMEELAATEGIDLSESYAYSDSVTDAPMLEVVGHPVAVNPDRALLKLARENDWEVRTFAHPVRLRDRMPVPPAGPAAAVGGLVAAGVAAGVVLWRRKAVLPPPPTLPTRLAASWRRRLPGR